MEIAVSLLPMTLASSRKLFTTHWSVRTTNAWLPVFWMHNMTNLVINIKWKLKTTTKVTKRVRGTQSARIPPKVDVNISVLIATLVARQHLHVSIVIHPHCYNLFRNYNCSIRTIPPSLPVYLLSMTQMVVYIIRTSTCRARMIVKSLNRSVTPCIRKFLE